MSKTKTTDQYHGLGRDGYRNQMETWLKILDGKRGDWAKYTRIDLEQQLAALAEG